MSTLLELNLGIKLIEDKKPLRKPNAFKVINPWDAKFYTFDYTKLKEYRFEQIDHVIDDLLIKAQGRVFLAGGALRTVIDSNDEIADYDLFFSDLEYKDEVINFLTKHEFNLYYQCPENKLFSYIRSDDSKTSTKVQLICEQEYSTVQDCINSFDFGACCAALDHENFYCTDIFINNIRNKKITMHELPYPVASFKRAVKYAEKGYDITYFAEQFIWHINGLSHAELADPETMRRYID